MNKIKIRFQKSSIPLKSLKSSKIAFTVAAKQVIKTLASAIFTRIDLGDLNFTVYYELKYYCTEFYESDWSYPNGGFWFLGYAVSNNYYAGRIGK